LERLSQFHNSAAFTTDMNALRRSNFCPDRLLAKDTIKKTKGQDMDADEIGCRYLLGANPFSMPMKPVRLTARLRPA
jgi:hypothetical protein